MRANQRPTEPSDSVSGILNSHAVVCPWRREPFNVMGRLQTKFSEQLGLMQSFAVHDNLANSRYDRSRTVETNVAQTFYQYVGSTSRPPTFHMTSISNQRNFKMKTFWEFLNYPRRGRPFCFSFALVFSFGVPSVRSFLTKRTLQWFGISSFTGVMFCVRSECKYTKYRLCLRFLHTSLGLFSDNFPLLLLKFGCSK